MPIADVRKEFAWLARLRQDGLPVSAAVLAEMFPDMVKASESRYDILRHRYNSFDAWVGKKAVGSGDAVPLYKWIDCVMEEFLEYSADRWDKGSAVPARFKVTTVFGEKLYPQRVLFRDIEKKEPAFLLSIDRSKEIGRGKGRTAYGKFLELLRETGVKLGIITNGIQFRLCYAGLDHDSWVQWDVRNWFEEEELRDELHGFYSLLGKYGTKSRDNHDFPLLDAVEATRTKQGELAGVMSVHVRESVEILIHYLNNTLKKSPDCLAVVYNSPSAVVGDAVVGNAVVGATFSRDLPHSGGDQIHSQLQGSQLQIAPTTGDLSQLQIAPTGGRISKKEVMDAVYQAAVRIVMRLVVVLFAEAKGLLSRSDYVYDNSYGINGLLEQLKNARMFDGHQSLEERMSGWNRLLALFGLLYEGSYHSSLVIPCYGGLLFEPGKSDDPDPVIRALSLFENKFEPDRCKFEIPDSEIYDILIKLTTAKVKIKHGRTNTWVSGPVDFSELRTEYIGMMYEGLLDYELKSSDQVMIFLKLGMEPVLPLDLLESLDDKGLKNLVDKLVKEEKKKEKTGEDEGEDEEDEEEPEEIEEEEVPEEEEVDEELEDEEPSSQGDKNYERAVKWALRVVKAGKLVKKAQGKKFDQYHYDIECGKRAKRLIERVVDAGSMYLARWGGTRKGTGTFYTPPGLAIPTTHRTIEPLVYNVAPADVVGATCSRDRGTTGSQLQIAPTTDAKPLPRLPEEILSIKVCDPSCGSGSFLVAALKYITDALYESLIYHCKINESDRYMRVTLPFGKLAEGTEEEDRIPCPPTDDDFPEKVKQRLRRYVAEWCIYGVDLNPLAVELCKLSLWIETMDNELPFNFLDHKIKAGNSLTGCWFDRYKDYPALAWLREGGDKSHSGVHYKKEEWTKVIREVYNNRVKPEMAGILGGMTGQLDLPFEDDFMKRQGMDMETHDEAEKSFIKMHRLPLSAAGIEERERVYRESFVNNPDVKKLKERFDLWCAVWFWDADLLFERELTEEEKLDIKNVERFYGRKLTSEEMDALRKKKKVEANYLLYKEIPSPNYFYKPSEEIMKTVRELTVQHRFFHWELEFPDVFTKERRGFDVVLGNPPWDTMQPESMQFFSNYDPIYRTYGKQDALKHQKSMFDSQKYIERHWLLYNSWFKSFSNWVKNVAYPFGDPDIEGNDNLVLSKKMVNDILHENWRSLRKSRFSLTSKEHPFQYQGKGKIYTYKNFIEISYSVVKEFGRIGMIVPSGIYTDNGSLVLRNLLLEKCNWEWLFSFENRKNIFDIDNRAKFAPIIIEKAGTTEFVKTSFMNHELKRWADKQIPYLPMNRDQVVRFSPISRAILEIRTDRDMRIIEKIYSNSVLLGDKGKEGWGIKYSQGEFNMTSDSKLFDPIGKFILKGYKPDGYGRWISPDGDIALPLYEGRMVGQFDFSQKGWVSGKGRTAKWFEIPFSEKRLVPQFLGDFSKLNDKMNRPDQIKVSYMRITSATNTRTMISTLNNWVAFEANCPILLMNRRILKYDLIILLNSFVFDYTLRLRCGGLTVDFHYLEQAPILRPGRLPEFVILIAHKLAHISKRFSPEWLILENRDQKLSRQNWYSLWAITPHERLRLRCILDAIVAELYGLDFEDFAWILRHDPSDPKGFWRVDKEKDIELRHTTLALAAFRDLKKMGLDEFCRLNDGEGWMIPETLTFELKEHGVMEFDTTNGKTVPVRSRMGDRFLPWQLKGTPEESWAECEMHARNILGADFDDFMRRLNSGDGEDEEDEAASKDQNDKNEGEEVTSAVKRRGINMTDNKTDKMNKKMSPSSGDPENREPDNKEAFTGEPYKETAGKKTKKDRKGLDGQLSIFESEAEQLNMFE